MAPPSNSPPLDAKKLYSYLRAIFFMMRKGILSKRKLLLDMNLSMKRGKLLRRSLGNLLMFHHHHHRSPTPPPGFALRADYYEFSCSNTPNPSFFHAKRRRSYFPCLNAVDDEADITPRRVVVPQIEYSPSPFSAQISNYSSLEDEEEEEEEADDVHNHGSGDHQEVDYQAEEFIKRFYEQLRAQRRIALLEYQEMLARGA